MSAPSSRIRATSPLEERFGFACGLSSVPVMARAHRHDDVEVVLPLGGAAVLDHGGTAYGIGAHECGVFWAGLPHRLADTDPGGAGEDVSVAWLTVPLVDVLAWHGLPSTFAAELLRGRLLTLAAPAAMEGSMRTWSREIGASPTLTRAARLEVEAFLTRAAPTARPPEGLRPTPSGPAAAATAMASFVSSHYRDPLSVADVAAVAHLHPSTAAATFRRHLGVTIGDYLAQCRTAEAQRLLISTDATTSEIALRAGFGSTSRFYARFVQDVGMPPAAYRRHLG
ncbi:helix-turn-helix domain-containing protein [Terrabacter sp. NPDC080008]|uniref:helix-turn-helix domain-containing protein n=1 Tax=Terrabacter sp. NPDC080008 TaxID=3155176 RepID=UPI00344B07C2